MVPSVRACLLVRASVLVVLGAASVRPAVAQVQFETVHEFVQGPGRVNGRMVQAVDGNLYGVTQEGGAYSGGTVFVMRRSGGEWLPAITLHDFRSSEGTQPAGGLIEGSPGVLYGTTSKQGAFGGGTVFRINVLGAFQVLASLNPAVHGSQSVAELTRGPDLNFYGTALTGGAFGYGTVFRVTPAGALTVLHAFTNADGAYPAGALGLALDGNLYGTTFAGGAQTRGTVFRISRTGVFTQLFSFGRYGAVLPFGRLTLATDGALYGVSAYDQFCVGFGCGEISFTGSVFKVTTSGVVSEVRTFVSSAGPGGGVTQGRDGWLYGATGGAFGVYRVRPGTSAFEWVVADSIEYGAGYPGRGAFVQADDGRFYMGSASGGVGGYGTIFSTSSAGEVRVHHSFRSDGFYPASALLFGEGGVLHGSTYAGGTDTVGTYYAFFAGGVLDTLASHPGGHGNPIGDLVPTGIGFLAPTDARIMRVVDRNVTMAWQHAPAGAPVIGPDGAIYAASGDAIVRINTDFSEEWVHVFNGVDGSRPSGLMFWEGTFYGVTREGGAFGMGTVFSVKPDGTFATLHQFNGEDGKWPVAQLSLTTDEGGSVNGLVGTTTAGGNTSTSADGAGTVFRVSLDGATFTTLHAFAPGEGSEPVGRLWWTTVVNRKYYGTTFTGGLGYGTVFAVSDDGTFETLHQFAPGEGAFPYAGVIQGADGALYGTTVFGGRANVGTIYRIRIPVE